MKRDLSRLAIHLKEHINGGILSLVGPYQLVLQQLAELHVEIARGAQVRVRVRWIEEGESSSSFFPSGEKAWSRSLDSCGADF